MSTAVDALLRYLTWMNCRYGDFALGYDGFTCGGAE